MLATNHATNVSSMELASAAGTGFMLKATAAAAITFRAGDIIDVFHNDIDVDVNRSTFYLSSYCEYKTTSIAYTARCYR